MAKTDTPEKLKKKYPLELELSNESKNELFKVKLDKNSKAAGKPIVDLEFPKGSLIVLISRDGKYITPNGVTKLEAGDKLQIMAANREEIPKIISALKLMSCKESWISYRFVISPGCIFTS